MPAKTFAQIALDDMRRPGFPTPYLDSYAINEVRPLGRSVASYSRQSDTASLVMGRFPDSRAFSASTNPDYGEIGWRSASQLADLSSRSWGEMLPWNQITITEESGLNHEPGWVNNTRIGCWGFEVWIRGASGWRQHLAIDPWEGETWSPTFRLQGGAGTSDVRAESNGIITARIVYDANEPFGTGYWMYHGYAGGVRSFNASDFLDVLLMMRFSLFVHDSSQPDDRRFARFGIAAGIDYYPSPRNNPPDYPGVGTSRNRLIRAQWPQWQALCMHTMTEQQIVSVGLPPSLYSTFENFDEGNSTPPPVEVIPAGPAPTKGRWVSIYNPTSPKARWASIAASSNVAPVWGADAQVTATIGVAFTFTPTLVAGTPAPTYSRISGPAWASVNTSTGAVTGTPTGAPTTTSVVVRATNASGSADYTLSITVAAAPAAVDITTTSLPNAVQNQFYSETLAAVGVPPFAWAVTAGSLPTGTALSGGVISGTPTVIATASFTVRVTDALGRTDTQALSIQVGAATSLPAITTATLPAGTVGTAYSQTIAATGAGTITRAVVSGTLAPGLSLAPTTGVLSGTPTAAGGFGFTVRATNAFGYVEATYYLIIAAPGTAPVASPWGQFVRQ